MYNIRNYTGLYNYDRSFSIYQKYNLNGPALLLFFQAEHIVYNVHRLFNFLLVNEYRYPYLGS